jgi:hypothetical protein
MHQRLAQPWLLDQLRRILIIVVLLQLDARLLPLRLPLVSLILQLLDLILDLAPHQVQIQLGIITRAMECQ